MDYNLQPMVPTLPMVPGTRPKAVAFSSGTASGGLMAVLMLAWSGIRDGIKEPSTS